MLEKINIQIKNCYGIKALSNELTFTPKNVNLIYAPNGTMKTSFSKVLKYLSGQLSTKPQDILNPKAKPEYLLTSENKEVSGENIFVVNGDDEIDSSKSFVNILASAELKTRYDELYNIIKSDKDSLMSKLKTVSHSTDCETEILTTFLDGEEDSIFNILDRIEPHIENAQFYDFRYNDVFDKKGAVRKFIETHKEHLTEYINNYENLVKQSTLYRSVGEFTFGTYQASQLSQYLSDGVFLGVNHKLILQNGTEIKSHEQLDELIADEQNRIINDKSLKKIFDKITKAIDKNTELRGFKGVIEHHPEWIPYIINYDEFKKRVWYGFLSVAEIKPLYLKYINTYREHKRELTELLSKASQEQELWRGIIDLYNTRFHVPIRVEISNQRDIILKQESANLQFIYVDNDNNHTFNKKDELVEILSKGERRAFNILQFIFEVESRRRLNQETLFVLDDISDSFDYQNKYAIIEYIKDLSENNSNLFKIIILTHNYDFYRTISLRLNLGGSSLLMAEREKNGEVKLINGQYRGDIYSNIFVGNDDDDKKFISMIPFVRNLVEYTKGNKSDEYNTLTKCLHIKADSDKITEEVVVEIMCNYTHGKEMKRKKTSNPIFGLITATAESIATEKSPNSILLENKIVLSIAIRLIAEQYLRKLLLEQGLTENDLNGSKNQTNKLTRLYKEKCPNDNNKTLIERINIMTPEVIHINSFMFEPLIDMSLNHLISLYNDCKKSLI